MNFSQEPGDEVADLAESVAAPAEGGKCHMIGYGILVPLVIGYFGLKAWLDRDALWFAPEAVPAFRLQGDAARAMSVAYFCGAGVTHSGGSGAC